MQWFRIVLNGVSVLIHPRSPVIKIVEVVTAARSSVNQDWLFGLCLWGIKVSMLERINSEMMEAVLGALFLKNAESVNSTMKRLKPSQLCSSENYPIKGNIRRCLWFGMNLDINQWVGSEEPKSVNTSAEPLSVQEVINTSSWYSCVAHDIGNTSMLIHCLDQFVCDGEFTFFIGWFFY